MDKKYVGPERRRFLRIKIPLFIFYRLETDKPFVAFKAIAENIGGQGLMFETEKPIPLRSKLYLEIYQPSVRYKDLLFLIATKTKVIWVNKKKDVSTEDGENKYQIGVKFIKIDREDRNKVIEYVERMFKG